MFILNNVEEETANNVWQMIVNFFNMVRDNINSFIKDIWSIDDFVLTLYYEHIAPLGELLKLGLLILTLIIFVLGTISLIKKSLKLVLVIAIVIVIFVFLNQI